MLDIKLLRENLEAVKERLATRGAKIDWESFVALDRERRESLARLERLKEKKNLLSGGIGKLKKSGGDATALMREVEEVARAIREGEPPLAEVERRFDEFMLTVPNLPHESVPLGAGPEDNPEVRRWGEIPRFDFKPKPHWEIGEELGILDFARAGKIAGARFVVYHKEGALLERALANFMLATHTRENGYAEVFPPSIVNTASLTGTSQLPKFAADLFKLEGTDYWLSPTAEVQVTNLFRGETLDPDRLPLKLCAWTANFRSEAGSYGKDTRGIIRLHQFQKVELVKFVRPEQSYEEIESLTRDAESILQKLGLPYRVVALCTGDLGFGAAKTYDIEVWLPGQNAYKEISSCSNFEAFQARRAGIRYRSPGRTRSDFVHTLNGSGLAVGRTLVAVLENYQQKDGTVIVPEALRPYMGGLEKIA
ncbi:MAG: serine--tRNA ligase [Deltaproteobacteria bacterium RIFCSPLOWO2_12_FULL_60_19]|nr:MAG: serine--tRNA ligase [Deltaproteobacteria bacterium RIFCSPLOWO2_12_FULL_60_19]